MDLAIFRVQNEMACPVCGQRANYVWGNLSNVLVSIPKKGAGLWNLPAMTDSVAVRCSKECGNVQMFDSKYVKNLNCSQAETLAGREEAQSAASGDAKAFNLLPKPRSPSTTKKRVARSDSTADTPARAADKPSEEESAWLGYLENRD